MSTSPHYRFRDRTEAGQLLAAKLQSFRNRADVRVLGLPRGGVPVAYEVARTLQVPLDICLVRKLGVPGQKELAMGAIAPSGVCILNHDLVERLHISEQTIAAVTAQEQQELERRNRAYRGENTPIESFASPIAGHAIILIDDGIATGATLMAAIAILKRQQPARLIVAVPVAPPSVCHQLRKVVDQVICLVKPRQLNAIGCWYQDFSQVSDQEVQTLLQQAQDGQRQWAAGLQEEGRSPHPPSGFSPADPPPTARPLSETPTELEIGDPFPSELPDPSETPPHERHR
ncbi:MAG: phosphoribosyltransferase [Synechococcales bacterium]|nr:phosphoribosyltransferase [Synechococcales bacterium]